MPTAPVRFQAATTYENALERAASQWGIQPEYWDIFGQRHPTTPGIQKTLLTALGVAAETCEQLDAACEQRLWEEWSRLGPRTLVASLDTGWIHVQVPREDAAGTLRASFCWEDGRVENAELPLPSLPDDGFAELRGRVFVRKHLLLPPDAPLGYHELHLATASASSSTRLIVAPERCWTPPEVAGDRRTAGIALSLYALRSDRNWGCGDLSDLRAFIDWAAEQAGVSFVGLNPLHALANREPYNTSPYLPISSFYRNPIYLDILRIPDFAASRWCRRLLENKSVQGRIAELRAARYVEYGKVWPLKLKCLKAAFRHFLREYARDTERARGFRRYVEAEGKLLDRYAIYCALDELMHKRDRNVWVWTDWPREYQDPESGETQEFAREHWRLVLFYKYIQWLLDEQLAEVQSYARERGLSIGLYHDLALATDRLGSDLWAHRPFYVAGARVGAPPDDFSPAGQDWAFPPPNSGQHQADGYRLFSELIRKTARHGGALRIDHVMRFFRLFWIPDGKTAREGTYVQEHPDDLLRILALESVRNRFLVVGEDLGTVEPYIRESLARYGVRSYRLLYFEKTRENGFKRPAEYPRQALASASTHDLPTLAGFWSGADIEARRRAGVMPSEDLYRRQLASREQEKQRLLDLLHQLTLLPAWFPRQATQIPELTGELHHALIGFLALTPSELMLVNQEDVFKDPDQQNLPGTTGQYPNWRHKMRFSIEELRTNPFARDCTAMLRAWLERTERTAAACR
ncbi:MAG TPA: 4-alpha-glucanotransferase [Bryobacteraceae bacterium]|nr:4-alpha-glucanotransferase [Bryobacteraceae bacterium]